jgi:hypothetical protein
MRQRSTRADQSNTKIYKFQPFRVGYIESIGIITVVDVEETRLSLYKSLLPEPLETSSKPQMLFYVKHFIKIFPRPMKGYLEAAICLRARHPKSNEGWYVLYMPVSSVIACKTGKWLGYPKYIPESLTLESENDEWVGTIVNAGRSPFIMKFSPEDVNVWWKDVHCKESAFFLRDKNGQINQMQAVIDEVTSDELITGNITVEIDSNEKWANLVSGSRETAPGLLNKFIGKVFLSRTSKRHL